MKTPGTDADRKASSFRVSFGRVMGVRSVRRFWLFLAAVALACLALSSLAWACTEQPYVSARPSTGRPGAKVTVIGGTFMGGQPVEIRWDSVDGVLLGTGEGPNFSVPVTIPNAQFDVYTLLAVQRVPGSNVASRTARTTFTVSNSAPATETNSGPSLQGEFNPSSGDTQTAGGTGSGQTGGENSQSGHGAPNQAGGEPVAAPPEERLGEATGSSGSPAAPRTSSPVTQVRAAAGEPVQSDQGAPASASQDEQTAESAPPPVRSSVQDLWSGFAPDPRSALEIGSSDLPQLDEPRTSLAIGLGFLMFGVTLAGFLTFAAVARRRGYARRTTSDG